MGEINRSTLAVFIVTASVAAIVALILHYIWRPLVFAVISALFLRPVYLNITVYFDDFLRLFRGPISDSSVDNVSECIREEMLKKKRCSVQHSFITPRSPDYKDKREITHRSLYASPSETPIAFEHKLDEKHSTHKDKKNSTQHCNDCSSAKSSVEQDNLLRASQQPIVLIAVAKLMTHGLCNVITTFTSSIPNLGDLWNCRTYLSKLALAVAYVCCYEVCDAFAAEINNGSAYKFLSHLTEQYSPHLMTGIFGAFTTGIAIRCLEQQYGRQSRNTFTHTRNDEISKNVPAKMDPNVCQENAHDNNDSKEPQHSSVSTTIRTEQLPTSCREDAKLETKAVVLNNQLLNHTNNISKSDSLSKRCTFGVWLMRISFLIGLAFGILALTKLFIGLPSVLMFTKYICIVYVANDVISFLNPEQHHNGWVSGSHMTKMALLALLADLGGPTVATCTIVGSGMFLGT